MRKNSLIIKKRMINKDFFLLQYLLQSSPFLLQSYCKVALFYCKATAKQEIGSSKVFGALQ